MKLDKIKLKYFLLALDVLCCTQTTSHLHSELFTDGVLQACNHSVFFYLLSALA